MKFKRFRNSCYFVSNTGVVRTFDREIEYVRNNGIVRRIKRGLILKIQIDRYGYGYYHLRGVFKTKKLKAHRMVAECFIGNCDGMTINHKDGNKLNNSVTNLEIVTSKDNYNHYINDLGIKTVGENHGRAKINDREVASIRVDYVYNNIKRRDLIKKYNISESNLAYLLKKDSWKSVGWDF